MPPRSRAAMLPLVALLAPACASDLTFEDGNGAVGGGGASSADEPRTACGGVVTTTPRTIARDVGPGELHPAGDALALIDHETGRITAIDPCSGEVTEVAALGVELRGAAVVGGAALVATASPHRLVRVRVDDGAVEELGPLAAPVQLVAHGEDLYGLQEVPPADPVDDLGAVEIVRIDAASGATSLLTHQRTWSPGAVRLVGASGAGAYFKDLTDCGCNPPLQLAPADGGDGVTVTSSAGAQDLAAVGDRLLLAVDLDSASFGEVVLDVVRVPPGGGEPEILLPRSEEHAWDVRQIAADERAVCWGAWGRAVRCMAPEPGSAVRVLGDDDAERAGGEDVAMSGGAVYWLSERDDGQIDLRAAVP